MTITVRATYENGVLRSVEPLTLPESEAVDLTIATTQTPEPSLRAPTPDEEDYTRRIKAAKSLDELYAVMATAPKLPEGYDLCRAISTNRKATGERLPFPDLMMRARLECSRPPRRRLAGTDVKLAGAVYALHAFQKKSKKGTKTPPESCLAATI
jgi:predicted DNA-binding antitoxin AbrB/MazE fold protein